jgi:hypothetical protein
MDRYPRAESVKVGARFGLDRALFVRLGARHGVCQVVGVRHRRPVEVPVSASVGLALARLGLPCVGMRRVSQP